MSDTININFPIKRPGAISIDVHTKFDSVQELTNLGDIDTFYEGIHIEITKDPAEENNGIWILKTKPFYTNPTTFERTNHYTDINNWSKVATLDEIPEEKYINTSIVPENIGDFKAGEPATPAEGMIFSEVIDKILFKYIAPLFDLTLSNTQSTWKGEEFIVNITYEVIFNASNTGFSEMYIDYKENNETNWQSFKSVIQDEIIDSDDFIFNVGGANSDSTNDGSTLNSLRFKFRFIDKYREEYSIERNVNLVSYDKPDVQWDINTSNLNPIPNDIVGTTVDFDIAVVNNSINAPLSGSDLSVVTGVSTTYTPTDISSDSINYTTKTFEPNVNDIEIDFDLTVNDSKETNEYYQSVRLYDYYFIKTTGTSYLTDINKYDADVIEKINTSGEITNNVTVNGTHVSLILPTNKTITYAQTGNGENWVFESDPIDIEVGGKKTKTYNIWKYVASAPFTDLSLTLKFN